MTPNQELIDKWNDLKQDLLFLMEEAKQKTDFDLQDDINIVVNKLNYHLKYSTPRYRHPLNVYFREKNKNPEPKDSGSKDLKRTD